MGLIYADLTLIRAADMALRDEGYIKEKDVRSMKVRALVDSGAYKLAINENIRTQLDLRKVDEQLAELANGEEVKLDVVGPVELRFQNRRTLCDAMVLPGDVEVLLGAIPMEDLDVVINTRDQTLIVNPESPYIAKKSLK